MRYLWDDWPRILKLVGLRKHKVLFLDFDGTLAAIEKHHGSAGLSESARNTLRRLSAVCRVAIVSGRGLADLKVRCRLKGVIYAGNHGLQIEGLHSSRPAGLRTALRQARCIPGIARRLRVSFHAFSGVVIEDKTLTVSLHHRNLRPSQRRAFSGMIGICREAFAHLPVVWRKGKRVWEIRPRHPWGKGDAVRMIRRRFSGAYPIVIGDDNTDEDMFRTVGRAGLTIRVGRHRNSLARYYLRSPQDVRIFLDELAIHRK